LLSVLERLCIALRTIRITIKRKPTRTLMI
jgi:hypothetical protein